MRPWSMNSGASIYDAIYASWASRLSRFHRASANSSGQSSGTSVRVP